MQAPTINSPASQLPQTYIPPQENLAATYGIPGKRVLGSSKSRLFGAVLRASFRSARWYVFLRETHTYLCRMVFALRSNIYSIGLDAGPVFQEIKGVGQLPCKATRQRISDMRKISEDESFPWEPTPLDFWLFVRGWEAGEKWERANRSADNDTPDLG